MKRRIEILQELRQIAPELEQILEQNAFRLPDSYLLELKEEILASIKHSGSTVDPDTTSLNLGNAFSVPPEYFESFHAKLMEKIAEMEAMQDPALDLGTDTAFTVPEGYFSKSKSAIFAEIALMQETASLEEELSAIEEGMEIPEGYFADSKSSIMQEIAQNQETEALEDEIAAVPNMGMNVPDDYFASLKSSILLGVAAEQEIEKCEAEIAALGGADFAVPADYFTESADSLKAIPGLEELNGMQHDVFKVPEGYFESSAEEIKRSIAIGEDKPMPGESKVISLPQREQTPQRGRVASIFKYVAAAAAMLTMFAIGTYLFQGEGIITPGYNDQFAELSDQEVNDFWAYLSEDIEDTPGMSEALAMMDSQPQEDIFDLMGDDISPEQMEEFLLEEELWDDGSFMEGI